MDNLLDFILFLAKSSGVKQKKESDYVTLSVPLRSMVDPTVFFEFFVVAHRNLKQKQVAIHLCTQDENEMRRVEVLHLNGVWKESEYREEIELYISNNKAAMFQSEVEGYLNVLSKYKILEEEFFPSLGKEVEEKYKSRLRQS